MATNYDDLLAQLAPMLNSAGSLDKQKMDQQFKLGKAEIDAAMKRARMSSQDTRYGIEQERESARERIQFAREEMERLNIPRMEIERYVAEKNYELAQGELAFKREELTANTEFKRAQLAKDVREMEEIGIPRMQIEKYVAEKNYEIQQQQAKEDARQFNVSTSGYMDQPGQLTPEQQGRRSALQAKDAQFKAAGQPGLVGPEQQELAGLDQALTSGGGRQATLDRERFFADEAERKRQYEFDVAQFGAELASTPDTYFQARRFQGVDIPRLMGGAGAAPEAGPAAYGAPTPGIATMGAYLSGQDPYGGGGGGVGATPYGGAAPQTQVMPAGAPSSVANQTVGITDPGFNPGAAAQRAAYGGDMAAAGPDQIMGTADDRPKQIAAVAKASPPSVYDGLNESDTAALKLMESIYKKGGQHVAGGEIERLKGTGRMGFMRSAGKLLGHDPAEFEAQYQAYRPSQSSSRLA